MASQYNEYQGKIKELRVEKTVIEKRNQKKEEKGLKRNKKGSRNLVIVRLLLMLSLEVVNVRKTMGLISSVLSVLNFVTSQKCS